MPAPHSLVHTQPAALAATPEAWSEEVREIMGRPAPWLLRSGVSVLAGALLILLVLGSIIRYPDTISARVTLTGTHPVIEIIARQSGHLADMRVKEKQFVKTGDILAIIRSPSDAATVLRLKDQLTSLAPILRGDEESRSVDSKIQKPKLEVISLSSETQSSEFGARSSEFKPEDNLGKLQERYSDFLTAWRHWRAVLADDYAEKSTALLTGQLQRKRTQVISMQQQAAVADRELQLAKEKFERMKALHARDSISTSQLQEQEQFYLAEQRKHAVMHKTVTEEEINAVGMEKALTDLQHERAEALRLGRERVRESANKLRADIDVWEADYILRAPADGMIAFHDFWSDQQFVTAAKQVFIIVPENNNLVARMPVTNGGAGKIRKGQSVRIRLDDYPYKEFGIVSGRVQSISQIAREGAHLVLVDLDYPLRSSYKRDIPFKQEMAGHADIITEDRRFIGRVFNEIRRAFVQTQN